MKTLYESILQSTNSGSYTTIKKISEWWEKYYRDKGKFRVEKMGNVFVIIIDDFEKHVEGLMLQAAFLILKGLLDFCGSYLVLTEFRNQFADGKVVIDFIHVSVEIHVVECDEPSPDVQHVFPYKMGEQLVDIALMNTIFNQVFLCECGILSEVVSD